jgi:hypothetical protein
VLDYQQKRVYLTLTHYQYWALAKAEGGPWEFVEGDTQDREQAEGNIAAKNKARERPWAETKLMSPWLEIMMPTAASLNSPAPRQAATSGVQQKREASPRGPAIVQRKRTDDAPAPAPAPPLAAPWSSAWWTPAPSRAPTSRSP